MSVKKTTKALDTEELLKILEDNKSDLKEENEILYENDILEFLSTLKIEPGEDKIKKYTLYSIYKVWSKDAVTKKEFYIELDAFLPTTSITGTVAYKINNNAIKLTQAAYSHFKKENVRLKSKFWAKHFENFLDYHSLKSGNHWINRSLLYFLYKQYTKDLKLDKSITMYLSKNNFYTYCEIFLKQKITKNGKLYAVSDNIMNFFKDDGQLKMKEKNAKKDKTGPTEAP